MSDDEFDIDIEEETDDKLMIQISIMMNFWKIQDDEEDDGI